MYDLVESITTDLPTWALALVIPLGVALYVLSLGVIDQRRQRRLDRRIAKKWSIR